MTTTTASPDFVAIKAKQNAAWASGDYAVVGVTLQVVGESLAERVDLPAGSTVLDVAAGNGNATLAFARQWHRVTSTDYVPTLLDKGRARAIAEGHRLVEFKVADAEELPFEDASFDAVVSTFGVAFAPNQQQSARELARVCKPGGTIGMANWTPGSFIGDLFKTIGRYVPPPAGVQSPANWGDRAWLDETFADTAAEIDARPKRFHFRYRLADHFIDVMRNLYGPTHKAFASLDNDGQDALERDIRDLFTRFDTSDQTDALKVSSEYLETVITRA